VQTVTIRAVVFDVGETLVDETRVWSDWADWLGIPRLTFMAVLGALIERGGDHLEPLRLFRPDIDIRAEFAKRREAGAPDDLRIDDLYPDAVPTLRALTAAGYRVGIVGNQPARAEALFTSLDTPLDFVASSDSWGVQKPDPAFFERIATELDLPPAEIAYVGDRLDNDVRPATAAGMAAIFIRRGAWAWIQAGRSNPPDAAVSIESLSELPEALASLG
jgi:HAD superfamily hydrolase (TIGR01662 family)